MRVAFPPDLLVALTCQSLTQLRDVFGRFPPSQLRDPRQLCNLLVQEGLLTSFQAGFVIQGRGESLLVGQYIILKQLEHGNCGVVYQARHRMMGRLAALKVFAPESQDSELLERFLREIQATAQLDHPHLIKAYEAGEHQGAYYLAMEFVEGTNLQKSVESRGPLAPPQTLDIFIQAAQGLDHAHCLGMVHRDVKPANIMVGCDGRVRVLDLGLVRFIKGFASLATSLDGTLLGTAAFMAPEQALGIHNADQRSDVYSLGASLYFALTGKTLFPEKTVMQQLVAHQQKPPPLLASSVSDLPPTLEDVYLRMVAKRPEQRFQTMQEVIEALQAVSQGSPLPAQPAPASLSGSAAAGPMTKDPPSTRWMRILPFWRDRAGS